ncbi:DNA-binding domain-containing protein [Flexithrix dorotheae]|uniref:HU family DNA-binding protein n=1 Tax=Flexithrix dorotheae TaxID=70993 RepID=UPI0003693289|nr:DNA-binding domain-containing protein [Flexithrix dorotheae]
MIKFHLSPNALGNGDGAFKATVKPMGSLTPEQLVERILAKSTTVSKADVLAVLSLYEEVKQAALKEGYSLVTPTGNFRLSIGGTFNSQTDRFDPSRHEIRVNISAPTPMVNFIRQASVEKVEGSIPSPSILELQDVTSNTTNQTLTPGGLVNIAGKRLKFDPANPDEGIFFIDSANTATRVDAVADNKPARLIFMAPGGLAKGDYKVEVRVAYTQNNVIRIGQLGQVLKVA